tara:strand:+ start:916 stop:1404 length:489 start_codon:yes stop_codon:yes gene_type:complete
MATSTEVTALTASDTAAGIVTKSKYRGNIQAIPFTLAITDDDPGVNTSHTISAVLPQEARVIAAQIVYPDLGTDAKVDLGYEGATDIIINGADVGDGVGYNQYPSSGTAQGTEAISTLGSIDVGGKILLVTVAGADAASGGSGNEGTIDATIVGHVLITTNE